VYVLPTSPVDIADTTAPTDVSLTLLEPNALLGGDMPFAIDATDAGAGVAHAEYFLGSADPGLGLGKMVSMLSYPNPDTDHLAFRLQDNINSLDTPGTVTMHYRVYDNVGNWSPTFITQFEVIDPSTDTTPPVLGAPAWSLNPKQLEESSTLTVPVTDDLTGVQRGEYYLEAEDPGQGNGIGLDYNGSSLTTEFGPELDAGVYQVKVRAVDRAGNWSAPITAQLVVGLPAPTGLNAASPTNNAPVLSWDAVPGAAGYQVWRQDTLTGTNIMVSPASLAATNFTDVYLPGVYNYTVLAVDAGGATSAPSAPLQVAVTNLSQPGSNQANNLSAQGQSQVVPVYGTDTLPGLAPGNTTKADFDFDLGYQNNTLAIKRQLTATFNAGGNTFHVASTSIDWLVINGTGNSVGTFQGLANVTLNGATATAQPFTITAVDGQAAGGGAAHNLKLTIYADAGRTTVLYQIHQNLSKGKVKIN
jgi:hypothetical protein